MSFIPSCDLSFILVPLGGTSRRLGSELLVYFYWKLHLSVPFYMHIGNSIRVDVLKEVDFLNVHSNKKPGFHNLGRRLEKHDFPVFFEKNYPLIHQLSSFLVTLCHFWGEKKYIIHKYFLQQYLQKYPVE